MVETHWLARPTDYLSVWHAMQDYTHQRTAETPDQIWLCEHAPVYTLGQAGAPEHVLNPGVIPLVHCDRGGQVTYHGPGQIVAYTLFDLRRVNMYVKEYVTLLESALIETLTQLGVQHACRQPGAPGVYVPDPDGAVTPAKIAALGIKIRQGRAYHGVSLNVEMDLTPFLGINPCGYQGLRTVDMAAYGRKPGLVETGNALARHIINTWHHARPDIV